MTGRFLGRDHVAHPFVGLATKDPVLTGNVEEGTLSWGRLLAHVAHSAIQSLHPIKRYIPLTATGRNDASNKQQATSNKQQATVVVLLLLTSCVEVNDLTLKQVLDESENLELFDFQSSGNTLDCDESSCSSQPTTSRSYFPRVEDLEAAISSEVINKPVDRSEWEARIEDALNVDPNKATIVVSLAIREPSEPLSIGRNINSAARDSAIAARKLAIQESQDSVEAKVESIGGKVVYRHWMVNHVTVEIGREKALELLGIDSLVDVSPEGGQIHNLFDGLTLKDGVRTTPLNLAGYRGQSGGREGGRIQMGILEYGGVNNGVLCGHPAYKFSSGASRIRTTGYCGTLPISNIIVCSSLESLNACQSPSLITTHGNFVAAAALGSIENGQDSNFPGAHTNNQRQRGGIQQLSELTYYRAESVCESKAGFEKLIEAGVDVVNMSWRVANTNTCSPTYDSCGMNAVFASAFENQIVMVAAAGNDNTNGICGFGWPAQRSEVIAVGGIEEDQAGVYLNSLRWLDLPLGSAYGIYTSSFHGGGTAYVNLVDLLAPARIWKTAAGDGAYTYTYLAAPGGGTSMASPVVAATAGLVRQWTSDIGWTETEGTVPTLMRLFGDGYTGHDSNPDSYFRLSLSSKGGYGRLRATAPITSSSGSTRYWATRTKTIYNGEVFEWRLTPNSASSQFTGAKAVIWTTSNNFQTLPKFKFEIIDKCPSQGGVVVVAAANSVDALGKRIQLVDPATQIHGRCLFARVTGSSVPSGGHKIWGASAAYSVHPSLN